MKKAHLISNFIKKIILGLGLNPRKGTKNDKKNMKIWRLKFCQLSSNSQPTLVHFSIVLFLRDYVLKQNN
jgi:hypothetical protein